MRTAFKIISVILLSTLLLTSCNLPRRDTSGPDAVKTAAAQTVAVQLSQLAPTMTVGSQETATPTNTLQATNTTAPTATMTTIPCDYASFIASGETVPDGSEFAPGQTFSKTWRFKNVGTCTWANTYEMFFYSGDQLGAPAKVSLGNSVAPGQTIDISVTMKIGRAHV